MLATSAGVGMAIISSEHFFSTLLSSPWTTAKFIESEEDKAEIRRLYMMAIAASLVTAGILSAILKQSWPLLAAAALCIFYILIYERAIKKGDSNREMPTL